MLSSLLRLLALRPLLGSAILGLPLLLVIVVGVAAIWAFKLLLWFALPALVLWLLWRWMKRPAATAP